MTKQTEILPGRPVCQFYAVDSDGLPRGGYMVREATDDEGFTSYTVHAVGFVPAVERNADGSHDAWMGKAGVIQHAQNLVHLAEENKSWEAVEQRWILANGAIRQGPPEWKGTPWPPGNGDPGSAVPVESAAPQKYSEGGVEYVIPADGIWLGQGWYRLPGSIARYQAASLGTVDL